MMYYFCPKLKSASERASSINFFWGVCIEIETSFPLNFPPYRQSRTCAPLTSLLSAAEAPQPLVCAIRAWSRPADRQATRTPPACASALRRLEALVLPRGPAPALARRRCQHGAGSRRQWRSSTPCSAGPGCLTSSSLCSHRGAATPLTESERVATLPCAEP